MAQDPEGLKAWKVLRSAWQEANQNAREARFALTKSFMGCADGNSAGPTPDQIDAVERLERFADTMSIDLDNFVKNRLG